MRREQYHAPHHVTTYEAFVHPAWVPELTADTDRPLVAGAVYNGTHTTPYALPEEKTESTRKSASSLGSNGFNEVRIEDAAGEEEVFIHSQKDEDLLTENDKDQRVRGYEDLLVKKDRKRMVEGDQELRVEMDDVGVVEGNQTLLVQKNRDTTTKGSHNESVEGNQAMTVGKHITSFVSQGAMENVALAKATTIGGAYSVNVALAYNEATGGARAVEIGAAHSELVVGSRQETVSKNKQTKVGTMFISHVKKGVQQTTAKDVTEKVGARTGFGVVEAAAWLADKFELKADTFNLLVNDKLILQVEKSGNTKFFANKLTLDGSDIKFKGSKVQMLAAGSLKDKSIKVDKAEAIADLTPKPMEFSVKDDQGMAMANQAFEATLPDGSVVKGMTDGSGVAKLENVPPGQCQIMLTGVDSDLGNA